MPNTKSAERRMRNSARKQLQNHSIKSRLKTLTRTYQDALKAGKKEDATRAYREVTSAFDKAATKPFSNSAICLVSGVHVPPT